ncbi:hypothetical protein NP493_2g13055 [Ridgeia piscesae]|uniref:Uncharacterized protein n=1 Tax=Ridgeia piscesae TaxID=27915 RepID=A0AAD9ULX9_RIDPI|nr:hypothetical protein NP493_2g13055 [Ridgeia piscesae]
MKTDERISIDEAIFRGLVNVERVEDSAKRDALVEAAAKVYSLKLVTDPCTNQKYNPTEAERRGLINKIQGVYMDPVSGKKMSIREAIAQGFIEAEELEEPDYDDLPEDVTTYATLQTVGGSEVTHISLVIDVATGEEISVMEAVRRGIIDPVAGVYTVPNTGETLVLSQALERGFVRTNHDPGHTVQMTRTVNVKGVVDPQSGRRMSPSEAARVGILDMQQQRLLVDRTTGQTISLKEAENRGLLVFESGTAPMLVPSKGVEFTVETETTYVTSADTLDRTSRERSPQKPRDTTNGVAVPEPEGPVKFTEALKMGLVDSENSLFFCSSTKTQMPVAEAVRSGILIADIPIQFETKQRDTSTRSRETSVSSTTPRPVTQPMDDSRDIITREHVERTRMSPAGDAGASGRVVVTKTTTVDRVTLKPDGTIIRNERSERRMDEEETYDESHVTATHRSVTSSEPPAVVVQNGSSVTTEDTRLGAYMTQPGFVITTEGHVLNVTTGARMSIEQALVSGLIEMPRDQVDCTAHDRTISDMSALASSTEDVTPRFEQVPVSRLPVGETDTQTQRLAQPPPQPSPNNLPRSECVVSYSMSETSDESELVHLRIEEKGDEITNSKREEERPSVHPVLNGATVQVLPAEVTTRDASLTRDIGMTLIEALDDGVYDAVAATFVDQVTGQRMRLAEAIKKGLVNTDNTRVIVSTLGTSVSLTEAMEMGVVDARLGQVYDPHTGRKVMIDAAIEKGIISEAETVSSLEELYKQGKYDPTSGLVTDPCTGTKVELMTAIEQGLVDRTSVRIHEPISGESLTITEAFQRGIMDPDTGNVIDSRSGTSVSFQAAVQKCLFVGEQPPRTHVSIEGVKFDAQTSDVIDPKSGEPVGFMQALREKIVDPDKFCVLNTATSENLPVLQALKQHLLDPVTGEFVDSTSGQRISFKDALQLGLVTKRSEKAALTQAIEAGLMTAGTRILDPTTKEYVTVLDAIKSGVFNPETGVIRDNRRDVPLEEAVEEQKIVTCPGRVSLCDALQSGIYDEDSGMFIGQGTNKRLTLEECITQSVINADLPELVDSATGRTMTVREAIDKGIVDPERGEVIDTKSGASLSFLEAVAQNIVIEEGPQKQGQSSSVKTISLVEAIKKGIYKPRSNTVIHPVTGQTMTIARALDSGLINLDTAVVQDSSSGQQVPLQVLIEMNLVDLHQGTLRDSDGADVPLEDAIRTGLILDGRPSGGPYSLIHLLDKGLYNSRTGEFLDPCTDEVITMEGDSVSRHPQPDIRCHQRPGKQRGPQSSRVN